MTASIRKVVVTWSGWSEIIPGRATREGLDHLSFTISDDKNEIVSQLADADAAFIAAWDPDMHRAARNLRWIHAVGGGVTPYLFPEMMESDIPFTCGKPAFSIPGAEFALGAMLMFSRRGHVSIGAPKLTQRSPSQEGALVPVDLAGKTLGILGMGGMGQALAPRAKAMGMRVFGTSRRPREAPDGVDLMYAMDDAADMAAVSDLAAVSDYLAIAVPITPDTEGIVSEALLARIKPGAFILDCSGRAALYDYRALERALAAGRLGGICFQPGGETPDMPPDDSAFWQRDNVVVTPCRGTSSEQEDQCLALFFDNLRRFESGSPLLGLVDKEAGY